MTITHYKNMFEIYLKYTYYIFKIFHYFMGYQKIRFYFRCLKNIYIYIYIYISVSLGSYSNSSTLFEKPMNLIISLNIHIQTFLLNAPIQHYVRK
jgi:hypothetical protein